MKTLKEQQEEWYKINAPFGKELGYPECCIKAFCDLPPALLKKRKTTKDDRRRYRAGCINGEFTGFIPCSFHAKQITMGKITLESLIKNRNDEFPPFPHFTKALCHQENKLGL